VTEVRKWTTPGL